MLTDVRVKRFFWNDMGESLNYSPSQHPMRQDFRGTLMENRAFYFTKKEILESSHCRLGGSVGIYEMTAESAVEVDEPEYRAIVENLLFKGREGSFSGALSQISLLVVDVDGTLTDAGALF